MHARNTTVWFLGPAQWPNFLLTLVWSASVNNVVSCYLRSSQNHPRKYCIHAPPFILLHSMRGKSMYGTKTPGRHSASPGDSQNCFVASVYQADFPRPTYATDVAVRAAFNVVHPNSFSANFLASSMLQWTCAAQVQVTSSRVFEANRSSTKSSGNCSLPLDRAISSSLAHVCTQNQMITNRLLHLHNA